MTTLHTHQTHSVPSITSPNILITGAAGYIGGSILAEFICRASGPIKTANISAAVRTEEQVRSLSKLGVNIIQVDLSDEAAVSEAVLRNEIDIIVHTASSSNSRLASNLIKVLGQRRKVSGNETYFIHSSVTTIFLKKAAGRMARLGIRIRYSRRRNRLEDLTLPESKTNILVTEHAKAHGVTSFNVAVPVVYGRGSGEWRRLSVNIPAFSMAHKAVYMFDKDSTNVPPSHLASTRVTVIILDQCVNALIEPTYGPHLKPNSVLCSSRGEGLILHKEAIPSGEQGYYFAFAHRASWWGVMQRLADALYARGLVAEPKVQVWPSYEMAAEYLGCPRQHIRAIGTSSGQLVPVNAYRVGWQPKWDQERFLESMDDEIQAVLELDTVKPTLFDSV
ncbi:NAD(P)-binding protein [Hypoxylon sp. FL0890]|nr:NAD(P)-binding protein [Hypoxylon sp. FL0890]